MLDYFSILNLTPSSPSKSDSITNDYQRQQSPESSENKHLEQQQQQIAAKCKLCPTNQNRSMITAKALKIDEPSSSTNSVDQSDRKKAYLSKHPSDKFLEEMRDLSINDENDPQIQAIEPLLRRHLKRKHWEEHRKLVRMAKTGEKEKRHCEIDSNSLNNLNDNRTENLMNDRNFDKKVEANEAEVPKMVVIESKPDEEHVANNLISKSTTGEQQEKREDDGPKSKIKYH